MGSEMLPQFAVLQSVRNDKYVYYHDNGVVAVRYSSVFDSSGHIEIERAKDERYNKKYVHLRFRHTNKYWSCMSDNSTIFGSSTQPDEDTSKPSCTLFEPKSIDKKLYLIHVHTKRAVQTTRGIDLDARINTSDSLLLPDTHGFNWVNCDDLVKLPKLIALKGDNGKYLKSVPFQGQAYLAFSSDDPNEKITAHEVELKSDGHVCIKSVYFGKYWRRSPNWIWGDSSDDSGNETRFWPVRLSDGKIALQSVANKNFLRRLTTEGKSDCLNAAAPTAVAEARFEIKELVEERKISNLRLRWDQVRMFDEKPFVVGTTTALNNNDDKDMNIEVKITKSDTISHSFSKSLAISLGVTATIEADFTSSILKATLGLSFSVTGTFTWDETTTEAKTIEASGSVTVPPNTKAIVRCEGKRGKCSIPFSYTQRDKRSTDGKYDAAEHTDGIFTAVDSYHFTFEVIKFEPIN